MGGEIPRYYWDACVLLSYIDDEPERAPLIEAMLQEADDGKYELYTSVLSVTEVAYSTEEKESALLDEEALEAIDGLWTPPSPLILVELYPQISIRARTLMRQAVAQSRSLKPPDAIHLATAQQVESTEVHTYDGKLRRRAAEFAFEVREPTPTEMRLL